MPALKIMPKHFCILGPTELIATTNPVLDEYDLYLLLFKYLMNSTEKSSWNIFLLV
jgi:hypothetical protein